MEAERAGDFAFDEDAGMTGFKMEQGSGGLGSEFGLTSADEPAPPAPARRPDPPVARPATREPARRARKPAKQKRTKKREKRKSGTGAGRFAAFLVFAIGIVGAGIYFGPDLLSSGVAVSSGAEPAPVELPPPPEPLIPDTEESLRERAQERFLTTTRALLRDLPPIPGTWLEGQYLASPSDYPEVRAAWDGVLTLIRQVRNGDNERYRAGYTRALDDALVEGSSRTLRLAGAVADFQGGCSSRGALRSSRSPGPRRSRGHDALVEVEGTIAYEPAVGTPVSGDPVIQAVGRNADAQANLEEILDMILAELEEPTGPGSADNLGEWVWDGVLDAVTG